MKTHPLSAGNGESNGEAGAMTRAEGGGVGGEVRGGGVIGGDAMLVRRAWGEGEENRAEGAGPGGVAGGRRPPGSGGGGSVWGRFGGGSGGGGRGRGVLWGA